MVSFIQQADSSWVPGGTCLPCLFCSFAQIFSSQEEIPVGSQLLLKAVQTSIYCCFVELTEMVSLPISAQFLEDSHTWHIENRPAFYLCSPRIIECVTAFPQRTVTLFFHVC